MDLCHIGLHILSHLTQVNMAHTKPDQTGRYSIYLPRQDGWLSWPFQRQIQCANHYTTTKPACWWTVFYCKSGQTPFLPIS